MTAGFQEPLLKSTPLRRFLLKFYGSESEVNLDRNGEREFSAYTWLPLEDIAAQVGACTALGYPGHICPDTLRLAP